jgi:hypothetical protein
MHACCPSCRAPARRELPPPAPLLSSSQSLWYPPTAHAPLGHAPLPPLLDHSSRLAPPALLAPQVMMFLRICFGATVLEGYGMTESCSAMTITRPDDTSIGERRRAAAPPPQPAQHRLPALGPLCPSSPQRAAPMPLASTPPGCHHRHVTTLHPGTLTPPTPTPNLTTPTPHPAAQATWARRCPTARSSWRTSQR